MMILSEINVDVTTSSTNLPALSSWWLGILHFTNTNNNNFGSLKTAAPIHHLWRVQKIISPLTSE